MDASSGSPWRLRLKCDFDACIITSCSALRQTAAQTRSVQPRPPEGAGSQSESIGAASPGAPGLDARTPPPPPEGRPLPECLAAWPRRCTEICSAPRSAKRLRGPRPPASLGGAARFFFLRRSLFRGRSRTVNALDWATAARLPATELFACDCPLQPVGSSPGDSRAALQVPGTARSGVS